MNNKSLIQPFGEISFETEYERLGEQWDNYFFEHTSFVKSSLLSETYLIVGRRGSGKSSLVQHFAHQDKYKNADCINVGKSENYNAELFDVASKIPYSQELAVQKIKNLWDFVIWQLIFKKLSEEDRIIKQAIQVDKSTPSASNFIKLMLKGLLSKYDVSTGDNIIDLIFSKVDDTVIEAAKKRVLEKVSKNPLFIVIDSREQYAIKNQYEMWATSALVQSASDFNVKYSFKGIHLKVCIADEIFPYLQERYITNTLKYIRNPLYMLWRPKDLMRLACWRLFKYLQVNKMTSLKEEEIDWDSHKSLREKIWEPHFGKTLKNRRGVIERTFPYILRHTHLRPRQLTLVCNKIARIGKQKGEFPYFSEATIKEGVLQSEAELSNEIINSYASVYEKARDIISSLQGLPIEFEANELYKAAHRTASHWEKNEYSPLEFIKLITELGIIGRKRGDTDPNSKIIKADFEFALRDRMFITERDTCVIHPLFYSKLNINRNNPSKCCVYPFPNNPEFTIIEEN